MNDVLKGFKTAQGPSRNDICMYLFVFYDTPSHTWWVLLFRVASADTNSRVLVLFGYAQTALNADATFEFRPHKCIRAYCQLYYCAPFPYDVQSYNAPTE